MNVRLTIATLATIAVTALPGAAAATTSKCSVKLTGTNNTANVSGSRFMVGNQTAAADFVVSGPSTCKEQISLTSWKAPQGSNSFRPFASQTIYDTKTATLGAGSHFLSVRIPNCMYQVDAVIGAPTYNGTADYRMGTVLGYIQMGTAQGMPVCAVPVVAAPVQTPAPAAPTPVAPTPATPAPAAPTATVTATPATPVATATATPAVATAAAAEQPTKLVNTGPGSTLAIFAAVAAIGTLAHRRYLRRLV